MPQEDKKSNQVHTVAEKLMLWFRESGFTQGEKLPSEKKLMEMFGVGRSSLREAIQGLALLGILEVKVGNGTFFRNLSADALLKPSYFQIMVDKDIHSQLVQARSIIEPEIVALACEQSTEEDWEKIKNLLKQHRAALLLEEDISILSASFHLLLAESSHNAVLYHFMNSILSLMVERGEDISDKEDFLWWEFEDHTKIFQLLKKRNKPELQKVIVAHIRISAEAYNKKFQGEED